MFTARIRALAGMSLLASAIGLAAFGAATGTANAAPTHQPEWGTYTCYDYATQTFYECFDPASRRRPHTIGPSPAKELGPFGVEPVPQPAIHRFGQQLGHVTAQHRDFFGQ